MIKLADTLAPMSNDFYAVESENVGIDIDGTSKSIQQAYEDGDLSSGGSSIQVDTMPVVSESEYGKIYQYIGESGTYTNGYFYEEIRYKWKRWNHNSVKVYTKDIDTDVGGNVYDENKSDVIGTITEVDNEHMIYLDTASGEEITCAIMSIDLDYTYTWIEKEVSPSNVKVDNESIIQDSSTHKISVAETYETTKTCKDIDEWNALSPTEQAKYENVILEQDETTTPISIVDMVQNGNMHAVTSNAVHDYVQPIKDVIPSDASSSNKLVSASDNNFKYQTVTKDTDFNTVKTPGVYSFGVSEKETTHAPLVGTFTLIVSCQNNDWVQQLAIFNGDGRTFVRISSSGNWSDWTELSKERNMVASSSSIKSLQALLEDVQPQLWIEGTYQGALIINGWGVGTYQMTKTNNTSANHKTVIYGTFSTASDAAQPFIATYTSSNVWNIIYTALKTLFTTPTKALLGATIPTTWTVHSAYNQKIVVKAQLKDFIPDGYKLYKATIDIAWTSSEAYDAYLAEVIGSSIATTTSGVNKEVEFSLYTRLTQTPGASYTPWNAYNCIIECVKE